MRKSAKLAKPLHSRPVNAVPPASAASASWKASSTAPAANSSSASFEVVYKNPKMNKAGSFDGTLMVNGSQLKLLDDEGKLLAARVISAKDKLTGATFLLGKWEVECGSIGDGGGGSGSHPLLLLLSSLPPRALTRARIRRHSPTSGDGLRKCSLCRRAYSPRCRCAATGSTRTASAVRALVHSGVLFQTTRCQVPGIRWRQHRTELCGRSHGLFRDIVHLICSVVRSRRNRRRRIDAQPRRHGRQGKRRRRPPARAAAPTMAEGSQFTAASAVAERSSGLR